MKLTDLQAKGIDIQENIPLSRYSFTETGGPAQFLAFPKSLAELQDLLAAAEEEQLPITVIGNASNLIISDKGIKGLVIILTKMHQIKVTGDKVTAEAGARIIDTSFAAGKAGLSGLEFAAGIPGSVGGAVFMNAGAYGGETKDCLETATVLTKDGQLKTYSNAELQFSYRHSLVQETKEIVVSAVFALKKGDREAILDEMNYLNALRKYKQPLEYPSCGSVFKRPTGHFVGPMLIKAGLQGKQIGGAQVSMKHAGFIVNKGGASAADVLALVKLVQERVFDATGIRLEPEVRLWGAEE